MFSFSGKRGSRGGKGRGKKVCQSSDEENSLNISEETIDSKLENRILNTADLTIEEGNAADIQPQSIASHPPRKKLII